MWVRKLKDGMALVALIILLAAPCIEAAPIASSKALSQLSYANIECPVCNLRLNELSPYAIFNENQRLHACSDDHLEQLLHGLHDYVSESTREHSKDEAAGSVCPLCGMEGSHANAIDFVGNQALFLCPMETGSSKEKLLSSPGDYISMKHTVKGDSASAYCAGRTVMYMTDGFTWSDTTCLVFMVSSLVIDARYKLWLAAAATFALAVLHEWIMSVRRKLVFRQRMARTHGSVNGYKSETQALLDHKKYKQFSTFWLDITVAGLYSVSLSIGYFTMLAVMTYHALLFFAAVLGFAVGQYWYKDCDAPRIEGDTVEVGGEPCCGGA